jgi:hypothetical protein
LISFAVLRRLLLRLLICVQQLVYGFIVVVVFCDLLVDLFFDQSLRPDGLPDIVCQFSWSASEEELQLFDVAGCSRSLVGVSASEFAVRAVMKNEAVHLDGENEYEDGSIAVAEPLFIVFKNRSDIRLDADADRFNVVVDTLCEESVEREEVRNIETEVVHSVRELILDILSSDFYVVHGWSLLAVLHS